MIISIQSHHTKKCARVCACICVRAQTKYVYLFAVAETMVQKPTSKFIANVYFTILCVAIEYWAIAIYEQKEEK